MATMNISLNDTLGDYAQERLGCGGFSNASDYLRSLIRKDRLIRGLASGGATPVDAGFWQAMRSGPVSKCRRIRQSGHSRGWLSRP